MSECCMTKEEIEKLLKYEKNETTDKFIKEDEQMSLETRKQSTEDIKEQAQELIDQAYQRGYNAGYSKAENDYYAKTEDDRQSSYELGLNIAWDAFKTIHKLAPYCFLDCFPNGNDELYSLSINEVIRRVREYEEKKQEEDSEIRVGDEVVSNNGDKGIVLCYYHETDSFGNYKEEWLVVYMSDYDVPQTVTKKRFKKTGKHYDVMSILKKMQEGENGQ